MVNSKVNKFLVPNVSNIGRKKELKPTIDVDKTNQSEFRDLLKNNLKTENNPADEQHGVNLSVHAAKRMQERNLKMDTEEFFKIKQAISTLKNKGGKDSLVITNKAAYIVDVDSNKIVTAIDKSSMGQNVFTKIDSTLFVD